MVNVLNAAIKVLTSTGKFGRPRNIDRKMKLQKLLFFIITMLVCGCLGEVDSSVVHIHADADSRGGFWRKKVIWKPRLVKDWQVRKVIVPLWKKVWGPVELKEWVPFPKPPPPGWKGGAKH